jgi:fatty-acyl-CoA synthase
MRDQGIGSWPARRARMTPDRAAIVHDGRTLSYAALHHRVRRLAGALRGLGVRRADRVAYLGPNRPELAETLFAAGALSAIFVPLNPRLAAPELAAILADCGARVLIWDARLAAVVAALRGAAEVSQYVAVGPGGTPEEYERLLAVSPDGMADEPVGLHEPCMIQYTSGTSGHPKGVLLTHANITWNCFNVLIDVDVAADEVSLVAAPMFHTAGLNQLFLPTFLKGGTAVMMSAFDPDHALELIEQHRVTWMFGVPAMFAAMTRAARWTGADLSSLRVLMCGGAPVPSALIRAYQDRGLTFVQGYGLTEAAPGALFLRARESVRKAGSAGTPCFFTDVRVVRPDLTDVAVGEPGEVVIQGPNVMSGYWQQPEATEVARYPGGWLRSGDAATIDPDGYVFVVGRVKDMFISGGENVYPAEVEQVLAEHPAVAECAVIGVPDDRWGEVGRAVVVLRPGITAAPAGLLAFLDGKLARYKIPRSVVFTAALPRNAAGKVVKSQIRSIP